MRLRQAIRIFVWNPRWLRGDDIIYVFYAGLFLHILLHHSLVWKLTCSFLMKLVWGIVIYILCLLIETNVGLFKMIWMDTRTRLHCATRESIIIVVVSYGCGVEIIVDIYVDTTAVLDYPRISNVFHFFLHAVIFNSIIFKVIIVVVTASKSMHVKMILVKIIVITFRVILSMSILPIIVIILIALTIQRLIA